MCPSSANAASPRGTLALWLAQPWFYATWTVVAAFGAYASMYGFRKPFTAGTYADTEYGLAFKTWLVTAQVLGYTLSKFIGIRVISEMPTGRRATVFLGLIGIAQLALLFLAVTPAYLDPICLFFNGLSLGLVFGLVLGFVEGRRLTEFFVAGLCASFILADGVAKSVGAWLLQRGIPEPWMPFSAGLVFLLPVLGFVWMLRQIPPPSAEDVSARSERAPMSRAERMGLLRRHGFRLFGVLLAFMLITVLRSIRADFAPEIWAGLGLGQQPGIFARSEFWVAIGVVLANGTLVLVRDNRRAFFTSLGLCAAGLCLALGALAAQRVEALPPFAFMVLLGVGMYIPYVAVHTTVFERLIALTRERGNIGFLMYLADALGYLGYAGVMLGRSFFPDQDDFLGFFVTLALGLMTVALICVVWSWLLYSRTAPHSGANPPGKFARESLTTPMPTPDVVRG